MWREDAIDGRAIRQLHADGKRPVSRGETESPHQRGVVERGEQLFAIELVVAANQFARP